MALIFKDRVKETTTSTGQGTITLAGAVTGFRSFADIGNTNTTYYCIFDNSAGVFEIGIGTYTASGTTLSRDTVLQTSAGNTTKINFSAGSKEVFCTYPAGKAVFLDSNGDLTINGTTYLNAVSNRWTKTATNNQTVFNGNDDAGTALSVNAYTQVFLNGIMLKETTDYALSNNNTITLTSGVSANDILESITFAPFNVANVLQPNNNLNDVASASTALTNLGGMPTTGGTFSGNVSLGSNDLSTTGKILFANMYATTGDLPSATTYHGMFAHVHGTGKAYYSHAGNWIALANESAIPSSVTYGIANTNAVKIDHASVTSTDYAKFTANGLEGKSFAEVRSDLNVADGANAYVHPNHSGEVTSTADGATVIADNVVDEANLKVSNSPVNGYFLSAQSGNTGGLTWAEAGGGAWEVVATTDATAGNAVSSMEFTVENDYFYQFLISVQASTNNEIFKAQYARLISGSPDYTTFSTYYTQYKFPSSGGITSTSNGSGSNTIPHLTLDGVLKNASSDAGSTGTPCTGIFNWHQTNQRSDSGYVYTLQRNGTGFFDYMNGLDGNRGFTMHRNITTDEIVRIKFKMNSGNMFGTIKQIRSAM